MNSVQKYLGINKPSDTLKNYLRTAGYDVDKWDEDEVRHNGMNMLNNAKSKAALSDGDYGKATTELQRYLALGAGQDAYRQSIADAEDEAKRNTAYNEYLNARVASYLGEIEGAAGQKGYTGTTEGNRIALQNNLANRQQAISSQKQAADRSAVSDYLQVADKANADYFNNMDLTESATQSRRETKVQNVKGEIENAMASVSGGTDEGIDDDVVTRLRNYIKGYDFEDEEDRQKVLSWYNSLYGDEPAEQQVEATVAEDYTESEQDENVHEVKGVGLVNPRGQYSINIDGEEYQVSTNHNGSWRLSSTTIKELNTRATGSADTTPNNGKVIVFDNRIYAYAPGFGWAEIDKMVNKTTAIDKIISATVGGTMTRNEFYRHKNLVKTYGTYENYISSK